MRRFTFLTVCFVLCLGNVMFSQDFDFLISATDNANSLVLTIGVDPNGTPGFDPGLDIIAPPAPPAGAFGAWLVNPLITDLLYRDTRDNSLTEKTFVIDGQPQEQQGDLILYWDSSLVNSLGAFIITDNINGAMFQLDMSTTDSVNTTNIDFFDLVGARVLVTPSSPAANQCPVVASPIADQIKPVGFPTYLVADLDTVFDDPDGDPLVYSVSGPCANINGSLLEISFCGSPGLFSYTVTATDPDLCSTNNAFTLLVQDETIDIVYSVEDGLGAPGGQVTIAVSLDPLGNNACSFGFRLTYDPAKLTYDSFTNGAIIPPSWVVNDVDGQGFVNIVGFSTDLSPLLGNGELALITLSIDPGITGVDSTSLSFSDATGGNCQGIDLTADFTDSGMVSIIPFVQLSGTINYFDRPGGPPIAPVSNLPVYLLAADSSIVDSAVTDAYGDYELTGLAARDYILRPRLRDDSTRLNNAIAPTDAFTAFHGTPGRNLPFTDPFQYKVGDANRDSAVEVIDAFVILTVASGFRPNFREFGIDDWCFIPTDFPLDSSNWMYAPHTTNILNAMSDLTNLDFIAGINGDANGSGAALGLNNPLPKLTEKDVIFSLPEKTIVSGQTVEIPIFIQTAGNRIGALEFELEFDPSLISYESQAPGNVIVEGSNWMQQIKHNKKVGTLYFGGFVLDLQSLISEDGVLAMLTFRINSPVGLKAGIELSFSKNMSAGNSTGMELNTHGVNGNLVHAAEPQPTVFVLKQNYPNPFNPVTYISFGLPKDTHVKIELYNTVGQRLATLIDKLLPAGTHEVDFDGSRYSSGVYFYRIQAGEFNGIRKMILMK